MLQDLLDDIWISDIGDDKQGTAGCDPDREDQIKYMVARDRIELSKDRHCKLPFQRMVRY